ncbi:MAG: hypothetical protein KDJ14_17780 [Xanthomonadales bacterium]|nr:hypothetical protein [Xanthomonadales bacterium]
MRIELSAIVTAVAGLVLSCAASPASAVEIGAAGQGQALIFPYYNAVGTNASLISVSHGELRDPTRPDLDPHPDGRLAAVQIGVPLADGGRLAFIAYLPDGASWTAAISSDGSGGAELLSVGLTCTYPRLPQREFAVSVVSDVDPTGHLEVFALGELPYSEALAVAALPAFPLYQDADGTPLIPTPHDCSAIDASWAEGVWSENPAAGFLPPRNSLSGSLQIVDLQRGVGLSTSTVALVNFSDQVLHRDVETSAVDWSDVRPARSMVMSRDGPLVSTWSESVDAVTAVLMADATLEFWQNPDLALATDIVVTLPTRPLYGDEPRAPFRWSTSISRDNRPKLDLRFVDRTGRPRAQGSGTGSLASPKCTPVVRGDARLPLDLPLQVLAFPVEGSIDPEAIALYDSEGFDSNCEVELTVDPPALFYGRAFVSGESDPLVSLEGHRFRGIPGVVTALSRSSESFEGKSFGFQLPGSRRVRAELP